MANRRRRRTKVVARNMVCHRPRRKSAKRVARGKRLAARMMAHYGGKRNWVAAMAQARRDKASGRSRSRRRFRSAARR